jgi:hypothetical protein
LGPQADDLVDRIQPKYVDQDPIARGVVDDVDQVSEQQKGVARIDLVLERPCGAVEVGDYLD